MTRATKTHLTRSQREAQAREQAFMQQQIAKVQGLVSCAQAIFTARVPLDPTLGTQDHYEFAQQCLRAAEQFVAAAQAHGDRMVQAAAEQSKAANSLVKVPGFER